MTDLELMTCAAGLLTSLLLALIVSLLRLVKRIQQLEQGYSLLESNVQSGRNDIAGLCSAAVAVDRRLSNHESRLQDLQHNLGQLPLTAAAPPTTKETLAGIEEEPITEGYDKAIQLIRRGASLEALVKSCGVTRDEAMLLMRLHGNRD